MTLKEAKKILKKEGFLLSLAPKVINQTGAIREFEKPEVCEAIKVANANKWTVSLSPIEWYEREARLKKEYEKSMTLEEAKDKLKKEGFYLVGTSEPFAIDEAFTEFESPEICEAMQIVNSAGYGVMMHNNVFNARKARLKEEYEKNTKAPGPGEDQPEEKKRIICCSASPKADFYYKHVLNEGNPALKEAASQFNDALLDEQAEKIKNLEHEKLDILEMASSCKQTNAEQGKKIERLGKEIARLKKIIHKKNMKIEELRKERSILLRGKVKLFGETVDLSQELCDKNEDLRLSKIREKNLTEVCQKYMKENEKLKNGLADKVVDKIDAQALKSAESALAYKEKVIAEKDDVIADLGKELAATKKELEEKTKLVEIVRNASKQYCEYGIAAEKMIQKMAKVIVEERAIPSDDFEQYRLWAKGYRFNPQLPELSEEEEKKFSSAKDTHPTEDNPEEVEMDEILERVRKALEEGHTVSIDYDKAEEGADQSATIVQHRKSIVDLFKEIKRLWQ